MYWGNSSSRCSQATIWASNAAVLAKAATASSRRVSSPTVLSLASSSSSNGAYCDASVTTVTNAWFFAAARTIAGPPTSMVSMPGSRANG